MDIIKLILAYILPIMTGFTAVTICERGKSRLAMPEKIAMSFILGSGLTSFYILYLAMAGIRFCWVSIAPFYVVTITIGILVIKRWGPKRFFSFTPRHPLWRLGLLKTILMILIALLLLWKILSIGFLLGMSPTYFDDSVANWNNKAKIFYHHRTVVLEEEHPDFLGGYLIWYPISIPLFKTWIHLCMGRWVEWAANLYTLAMFLSLGVIAYYNLSRFLRPFTALIFTYLTMSVPLITFHAGFSYADLVIAIYFFIGIIYLIRWIRERDTTFYYISALIFSIGISAKNEMIPLFISSALSMVILYQILVHSKYRTKIKTVILYLGLVIIPNVPWFILKRIHNLSIVLPESYREWEFHPEAFGILYQYFFHSGNYNILWLVFLFAVLVSLPLLIKTELKYLLLSITGALFVTLALFIITSFFKYLQIGTTINRALLILLPLIVFYIAALYGKLTGENNTNLKQSQIPRS